jgi:hypothetical protein
VSDDLLKGAQREGYEWEEAPDLTSVSEEELRTRLRELSEEERAISYRRRVLQGRIDLIRAPEELAHVLLGRGEDRGASPGEGG